ncbi:MAG: transposase [Jatrophihabitans sp.]
MELNRLAHNALGDEFRHEAVQMALASDESRASVARRLGVNETTLRNWVANELAEQANPLSVSPSERSCAGCDVRSRSCGSRRRFPGKQPPIRPRRRSGLPRARRAWAGAGTAAAQVLSSSCRCGGMR